MDWIEILVTIPVSQVDKASDVCTMVVPYGFYIEDYSELEKDALEIAHIDLIDEIFGYTISASKSKPTNSEFIAMISDYLNVENRNKVATI